MEKIIFKRKRSENWNKEDKILLKELIKQRFRDIENKNTDINTNNLKKAAWTEVEENFNNLCKGGQRNVTQLKTQWKATKVKARREAAQQKKEELETGGGAQSHIISIDANDINTWLSNNFVVDANEYDSDVIFSGITKPSELLASNTDINTIIEDPETKNIKENVQESAPKLKKKSPSKKRNTADNNIKKLTEFDVKCRKQMHELQIEAEKKKIRNLDRKFDLIEAKIKYYEKKPFDMYLLKKKSLFFTEIPTSYVFNDS